MSKRISCRWQQFYDDDYEIITIIIILWRVTCEVSWFLITESGYLFLAANNQVYEHDTVK